MQKKRVLWFVFFSLFLFLCDAGVKLLIYTSLPNISNSSPLYPYGGLGVFQNFFGIDFCINRVTNQGGAWGIFAAYPKVILIFRICIIFAVFIYAVFINKERKRSVPFLLILTGALSNIVDYFLYGSVIDMFHFTLWNYSFPVFNVADMIIFFGVTALLIQSFFEKYKLSRKNYETQSS